MTNEAIKREAEHIIPPITMIILFPTLFVNMHATGPNVIDKPYAKEAIHAEIMIYKNKLFIILL